MKKFSKILSVALLVALVLSLGVANAFAANDGSISITNATANQTYDAYLIFSASPSDPEDLSKGVSYTATASQVAIDGFSAIFDTIKNADGSFTVSKKSGVSDDSVITFIKNNFDALKQGSAIHGTFTNNDIVTFSNLGYGYYYITSSLGSLVTIDTAGKAVEVYDKNETTPTPPDKDITAEDSAVNEALDQANVELDGNDASVGSVESFQIDFNATNWVKNNDAQTADSGSQGTKVTEYNFKDTPVGLSINATTVKVYVNWGTDAQEEITSTIDDIAVDSNGVLTFTIPWVDSTSQVHLYAPQTSGSELIPVHIIYNATVTDAAAYSPAPNTVDVKYNHDTELGQSGTVTYTYKFVIEKQDENGAALEGAEFELYYGTTASETATALTFTVDPDGNYLFDPAGTVTHIAPVKGAGEDAKATATVIGLDNASYMLREVVVPAGYNKAADTAVTALTKEDTGEEASVTTITVKNNKGTELPSTGGIGTTIFYVVGGVLVLAAIILLVTKKRMSE